MRTRKLAIIVLMCLMVFTFGSCGSRHVSERETNPVIEDYLSKTWFDVEAGILATTASRRTVLMKLSEPNDGVICAEPPPDVGEALAKSLAASLSVNVTPPQAPEIGVDAAYKKSLATAISALLKRSQGLQLLRDQNYNLCIDRMNNWITKEEYDARKKSMVDLAADLVEKEIPYLGEFSPQGADAPSIGGNGEGE